MSEITRAYAVYKNQQYNASYSAGEWSVDIPSGSESSYSQSNHTYPIELHAFDAAGNETIMYATDPTYGDQLNIRVPRHRAAYWEARHRTSSWNCRMLADLV